MTDDERIQFILDNARIPLRYRDKTLDYLDPALAPWVEKARHYVENFPTIRKTERPGLAILSQNDVGIGKTHLAICILRGLILYGHVERQGSFYPFGELVLSLLAQSRGEMDENDVDNICRLTTSDVIVFDDVDKFSGTVQALMRLHRVIDDLWNRNVPIILTSNLSFTGLVERFKQIGADDYVARAIVSRLSGMCQPWHFEYKGQTDFRVKG